MTILRDALGVCAAFLAVSCVVTVRHDDREKDAGDGGGAGGLAATGGAPAAGGAGTGGAGTGGASSGGMGTGGSPAEAGPDAPGSGGASADGSAEGAAPDARAEASVPDAATCSPASGDAGDPCDTCVQTKCCAVYLGCDDLACSGDGTPADPGEYLRFHGCMQAAFTADGGSASVAGCIAEAGDAGAVAPTTQALIDCVVEATGDAGSQNCSVECYGSTANP